MPFHLWETFLKTFINRKRNVNNSDLLNHGDGVFDYNVSTDVEKGDIPCNSKTLKLILNTKILIQLSPLLIISY